MLPPPALFARNGARFATAGPWDIAASTGCDELGTFVTRSGCPAGAIPSRWDPGCVPGTDVPAVSSILSKKVQAPPDGLLAVIAGRQHGVVTVAQLRASGLGDAAIGYRVRMGRLHRLYRGVYAVGHPVVPVPGHRLAAVLAVGPAAVLSHLSAAAVWDLVDVRPQVVDVTVARPVRSRRGIRVHAVRDLDTRDHTSVDGIPITTVARTLLDLAEVAGDRTLRRAVREAYVQRRVDERALRDVLGRSRGRHGAPRLAAIVASGFVPTRSELEDRVLDLLLAHGLPRPAVNVVLPGLARRVEVDFLFEDARLVVEADGARFHDNRLARDADAARQAMLEAAGFRVVRVNWTQVTKHPGQTVRRLRQAVGDRGTGTA